MADIVASSKKKINLFDRVIQSVVIMVNMNKMNRAIDEHLSVIRKTEGEEKKLNEENILREIVFVKYQYDIMQREMYELKISYPYDIVDNINSTDKIERLELQKTFLEMEYDRVTKAKFKPREDIKQNLLAISSAIEAVKQDIKDEGKSLRYNKVISISEEVDSKIQLDEYQDSMYDDLFKVVDDYVTYLNDNYDISKLPIDERELIEYVIETMIKGIESDIDKHMYEYNLIINICKSAYRYFKIIDKIFIKLQAIYDESLEKDLLNENDYIRMYREIYDMKIKTQVNDIHRTLDTEDEYIEYSKLVANFEDEKLNQFITNKAIETTNSEKVKSILANSQVVETIVAKDMILDDELISKNLDIQIETTINSNKEAEEYEIKEESKVKNIVKKVARKITGADLTDKKFDEHKNNTSKKKETISTKISEEINDKTKTNKTTKKKKIEEEVV